MIHFLILAAEGLINKLKIIRSYGLSNEKLLEYDGPIHIGNLTALKKILKYY